MTDDELKGLLEANAAGNRHFFQTTAESLRRDIQLVAEGVNGTRESLEREIAGVREEVRRGALETQAMIKFSHVDLDRRVLALEESQRLLEQSLDDVQQRLQRLESIT
jgi:hypothetical protein